jgi:hypothetical protein
LWLRNHCVLAWVSPWQTANENLCFGLVPECLFTLQMFYLADNWMTTFNWDDLQATYLMRILKLEACDHDLLNCLSHHPTPIASLT